MTFNDFEKDQHEKRVDHYVNFCTTENRAPCIADAVEIFGFVAANAKPIVEDAIQQMAAE